MYLNITDFFDNGFGFGGSVEVLFNKNVGLGFEYQFTKFEKDHPENPIILITDTQTGNQFKPNSQNVVIHSYGPIITIRFAQNEGNTFDWFGRGKLNFKNYSGVATFSGLTADYKLSDDVRAVISFGFDS